VKPKELTPEQMLEWAQRAKEKERKRWMKWYRSPKGAAYRQRQKEKKALEG